MMFSEWFDVRNIDHLKAYRQLQLTGVWPVGFLPSDVDMEPQWQFVLLSRLADAYLAEKFGQIHACFGCRQAVEEDETVWIDPKTGAATTGKDGQPFHVGCAPEQHGEPELTEESLKQIYQKIRES